MDTTTLFDIGQLHHSFANDRTTWASEDREAVLGRPWRVPVPDLTARRAATCLNWGFGPSEFSEAWDLGQ